MINLVTVNKAVTKLRTELKEAKKLSNKAKAISEPALFATEKFASQEEEYSQAIIDSKKTFADALEFAVKGCGSSISDISVYRKIAQFYFPGAAVHFEMVVDLCGGADENDSQSPFKSMPEKSKPKITVSQSTAKAEEPEEEPAAEPAPEEKKSVLSMSFSDLFD